MARTTGGCLLGLALGDALGAPFEFLRGQDIPRPIPALERPWTGHPPGTTTDDTAMARNLARSLIARGGFDPLDLAARHVAWFTSDPPDVGSLTRRVLRRVSQGIPAEEAAEAVWRERGPEVSAGNGSVMYCAPLGVAYANRPDELEYLVEAAGTVRPVDGPDQGFRLVAGALTAAAVGRSGLPTTWLDLLVDRLELENEAEGLAEVAGKLGSPRRDS